MLGVYCYHLSQRKFPNDAARAQQFADLAMQVFTYVFSNSPSDEPSPTRFEQLVDKITPWKAAQAEFARAGVHLNNIIGSVENKLRRGLAPRNSDKVQRYYLAVVSDWLEQVVVQQVPWLFIRDRHGQITKLKDIMLTPETLLAVARGNYKGFHMYGLLKNMDYIVGPPINNDGMRFVQLTSLDALEQAGRELQNCLQYPAGMNDLHINYHEEMMSGRVQFIALCNARGGMHGLLRIADGVLLEASGKQSALLAPRYMHEVIEYLYDHCIVPSPYVFLHGVIQATRGLTSYLELVNKNRRERLCVNGDLILDYIRRDFKTHGLPFDITNLAVQGTLFLDNTQVQSITNTQAARIVITRSPELHELDRTVVADELHTDRHASTFRLHMIDGTNYPNIHTVVRLEGPREEYATRRHRRVSGKHYALQNGQNNPFIADFGNAKGTTRPRFGGNDDGAPPSSTLG